VPALAGTEAVLEIDAENGRASQWHTDVTFVPAFPQFSVLRGVVIPPVGGDAVWANAVAAYGTLPPVLRGLADKLWALHSNAYDYGAARPTATAQQVQRYETVFKSTVYETKHPVVQVHPQTGERAIMLAEIERRFAELIGREPRKLRGARHRPCEHLPGAVTNRSVCSARKAGRRPGRPGRDPMQARQAG
jgi:taurine dioxygenase